MADTIKAALQTAMKENKPNSGHRPPNLTVTENEHRNCSTCIHWNGSDRCRLYDYAVRPNEVCDSWSPKPT